MSKTVPSSPEITDDDSSISIDMISDDEDMLSLPDCALEPASKLENSTSSDSISIISPMKCDAVEISSDDEEEKPTKPSKWKKFVHTPTIDSVTKCETKEPCDVKPVKTGHVHYIGGVPVEFPFKPYSAQIAVMFKVILGLTRKENCLLESPTGSGKTLALLCSALAWQAKEKERISKLQMEAYYNDQPQHSTTSAASKNMKVENSSLPDEKDWADASFEDFQKKSFGNKSVYDSPTSTPVKQELNNSPRVKSENKSPVKGSIDRKIDGLVTIHGKEESNVESDLMDRFHVPRIYYGARTHKQIAQVVRELKRRCSYARVVTAVTLSSREHSCLRELDTKLYGNRNEMCREVTKPIRDKKKQNVSDSTGCAYFDGRKRLFNNTPGEILDVEELVELGARHTACPYYAARHRATTADIVFCPYNYLIDPSIRNSMQIDLKEDIVIIDEAHNIEDVCRDSAGLQLEKSSFVKCRTELETVRVYSPGQLGDDLDFLIGYLNNWDNWFANHLPLVRDKPLNFNEAVFTWDIRHFVTTLDNHNIGLDKYQDLCRCTDHLSRRVKEDSIRIMNAVKQQSVTLLETLSITFGYLFRDGLKYMDDFKPALVKSAIAKRRSNYGGWNSTDSSENDSFELSVRLVCLNPGLIFSALRQCRSVILASGTLTPSHSIATELQTHFKHQVFAEHVISRDRVWVGSVTSWDGIKLECTYKAQSSVSFQDALGAVVAHASRVTPGGVLVFLPSYSLRDKLINRWKESRLWEELTELKQVFAESRNARDHNDVMEGYLSASECGRGALLFAVYRGKVSEGMDFRDAQARCVLVVGVPFPNVNEMSIESKMKYNDNHVKDRNLLPSAEWLKVQAYRALNQAAGRCVRHCDDWGAVLLVDHRFAFAHYTQHLSKWLLNFLNNNHHTSESLLDKSSPHTLARFMQKMQQS